MSTRLGAALGRLAALPEHSPNAERLTEPLARQRRRLLVAALLAALATGCAIGLLATSGWLISRASQMPPVLSLGLAIVFVRGFGIGRGVFRYAERLGSHDATFRALTGVRVAVYERLERLAPGGLAGHRRGDLLGRLVIDVDAMQDLPLRVLLPAGSAVIAGGAAVAVTWWLLPAAGLVLLVALLVGGLLVPWLAVRADAHARRAAASSRGELSAQVLDLLRGSAELAAAGATDDALARVATTDRALTSTDRTSARALGAASGAGVLVAGAAVLGALIVGVPAVRDGSLDGVLLAVVVLLPLAAYEAVVGLPAAALALAGVRASAARVVEVLDSPDPLPSVTQAGSSGRAQSMDRAGSDGAGLQVRGLRVRWPGQERFAVDGVDLDLAPGRRIAVVGTSGAGKSTIASALLRFVDHEGSVTLDGVQLRDLDDDTVHRRIGLCAQDAHVFDTTLADNLRLARAGADDSDLRDALGQVRLLTWVDGLTAGLETYVGEHGSRMSGGQRQRLALARVLLLAPEVVVLDEPAEHLDDDTADALTSDLLRLTAGRTTLLVTHRMRGLEAVDEIVVLAGGRVTERGAHAELMAQDGQYRKARLREDERIGGHVT